MTAPIGDLLVTRGHSRTVIQKADKLIYVHVELLKQLNVADGYFQLGTVRYHVVGQSVDQPGSMLCERAA